MHASGGYSWNAIVTRVWYFTTSNALVGFVAIMTPAYLFQASNQLTKPLTFLFGCLTDCLAVSREFLVTVSLSKEMYSPLAILAAYLEEMGGQQGTERFFSFAFVRADRRWLLRLRFRCLRLRRRDRESTLVTESDEESVSVPDVDVPLRLELSLGVCDCLRGLFLLLRRVRDRFDLPALLVVRVLRSGLSDSSEEPVSEVLVAWALLLLARCSERPGRWFAMGEGDRE